MRNRLLPILIAIVLAIFVLNKARGQSGGFTISGADAILYIDQASSPPLDPNVEPRFVVQYANAMNYLNLVPIPILLPVEDRFILKYANANRFVDLNYPANLVGDTDPPAIQNLAVNGSGLVSWDTDEYADGELFWGDQPGVYTSAISNTLYSLSHQLQMSGLNPGKIYYYIVASTDRSGNASQSAEHSFVIDAPVAGLSASNDSPNELGSITTFTATITSGTNVAYTWDFGDGYAGTGQVATHTYAAVGTYQATVTAANSVSSVSKNTTVSIVDVPVAGLVANNNGPTELGQPTTLSATVAAGSNVVYTWDFGDGQSGSGPVVNHTYPAIGFYTAKATAANGVSSFSQNTTVHIVDAPISGLSVSSNSPTELGQATILNATVAGGSNVTYAWDFGDGQTGSGSTAVHQYAALGTYTATVTATNSVSNVEKNTSITIVDAPISGLHPTNDSPTRLGSKTIFSASVVSGSNVIYTWDFGDGETGSGSQVMHMYSVPGKYKATVTASNSRNTLSSPTVVIVYVNQYLPLIVH